MNQRSENLAGKTVERIPLGRTSLRVSPLGVGTWAWGDTLFWEYGNGSYSDDDIQAAFDASLEAGLNFFDTAEAYGSGRSEVILGRLALAREEPLHVATKFMPFPWRLREESLHGALKSSLLRLGQIDLYQVHWPFPPVSVETWMEALADAVEAGLINAVGVSNYNEEQMRRAHVALARRGIPLASNQVEYSLLNRAPEENGVLDACRELGVSLIAYSPLAQGLLTGKYTPQNPPPGIRGLRYRKQVAALPPLLHLMEEIGAGHGGKTPAQIALNWTISRETIPIPGAKNARQARDNAGALGWHLAAEEIDALNAAAAEIPA